MYVSEGEGKERRGKGHSKVEEREKGKGHTEGEQRERIEMERRKP